ncbi:MAG: acylhydrolase [Lachnospiraceae bacterium]|nr:acylhydrolase [Lachnospiraceae bacterium]
MRYIKKCPFLILLIWTSAIVVALHYGGYMNPDTDNVLEFLRDTVGKMQENVKEHSGQNIQLSEETENMLVESEEEATGIADAQMQDELPQEEYEEIVVKPQYELRMVDDAYFEDAVFIGDSRTVGLYQYGNMTQATFYAETGYNIYKFFDGKIVTVPDSGEKITVEEALMRNQYKKVYLMIGINEMGRGTLEGFMEEYTKVVKRIKELQPDAIIILEAIMKVGKEKSDSDDIFNNVNITKRNAAIAELADNESIFYFDMNPAVVDEDGNLNAEYSFDGIHLKAQYVQIWKDYLYANGIVRTE